MSTTRAMGNLKLEAIAPAVSSTGRAAGAAPGRGSHRSYCTFGDPDGNGWILPEVTDRRPGRIDSDMTTSASAAAMRRALIAHDRNEKRTARADANRPDWYAAYMVAERTGAGLPK